MNRSESIAELAKALSEFNKEIGRIEKDANNPFFKNQYTTLDNMLDTIRPLLSKNGLSIMQMPSGDGNTIEMTTILMHNSGEFIESPKLIMKPAKNDPQGLGSATTYAKRYQLGAFLGLSTGDVDDDGNKTSNTGNSDQKQRIAPQNASQQNGTKASDNQVKMINAKLGNIARRMGTTKEDILVRWNIKEVGELSKQQASAMIDRLAEMEQS
jgi:hypothetical protein